MSQYDFGTIDPSTKSGTALAGDLNNWRDALNSKHIGTTRPTYIVDGMIWIDNTDPLFWKVNVAEGVDDILIGTVDTANDVFVPTVPVATSSTFGTTQLATYASRATDNDDKVVTLSSLGSIVSGFDRCNSVNLYKATNNYGTLAASNAFSPFPTNTWTTIGPTGSGATYIWTALDSIPINAKHLVLAADATGNETLGANVVRNIFLSVKGNGDLGSISESGVIISQTYGVAGSWGDSTSSNFATVPLDSDNIFEMYYGSTWASYSIVTYLKGWME